MLLIVVAMKAMSTPAALPNSAAEPPIWPIWMSPAIMT